MKTRTMYMHTLDGVPARIVRMTRKRAYMVKVTRHAHIPLHASAGDCRREWNEACETITRESKHNHPLSPREMHDCVAFALLHRLDYVLVKVPV